ncbi:MAG: HAMP domain-containing histidine kinase [Phycisphaerales bacterium]|nr:HAMP domain-containing histidine kinase [Phycisphaerales bacterium]
MTDRTQHFPPPPPLLISASTNLVAKVAHELNNPLDAVLRFVSLAQRKAKIGHDSDIERYLADAQFGLQRMAEVLRELMDLGRQTNDILAQASPTLLPLSDLVSRATRTVAAQAEQKQVALTLESVFPREEDNFSPCYDLRVTQILSNLLKNAIEAAPEGSSVRLAIRMENGETGRQGDKELPSPSLPLSQSPSLLIQIEDSGPGIPPDLLPNLFTPFLTTKSNAGGGGHGLGLAISRELALSLNGNLILQNRSAIGEGRGVGGGGQTGCIATLTLPLANT